MSLPTSCPLCGASSSSISVVTPHVAGADKFDTHAFFHCSACDVRFQYPFYSDEELDVCCLPNTSDSENEVFIEEIRDAGIWSEHLAPNPIE